MRILGMTALALTLSCASHAAENDASIKLNPQSGYGAQVAFPQILVWNSLVITLERGICFGTCPIYSVEIHGDGSVLYKGVDCVAAVGERRSRVSVGDVHKLVDDFRAANFFSMRDHYAASVTDLPAYRIGIGFDGHRKTVLDYVGSMVGMPPDVAKLEDAVDKLAGTAGWIGGKGRMCNGVPAND